MAEAERAKPPEVISRGGGLQLADQLKSLRGETDKNNVTDVWGVCSMALHWLCLLFCFGRVVLRKLINFVLLKVGVYGRNVVLS
eukprot:scaffold38879_cov65-Cyclotella_meneghiniana.AAC.3